MRVHLIAAAALYFVFATAAWAQTAPPADSATEAAPGSEAVTEGAIEAAEEVGSGVAAEIKQLRSEIRALMEETRTGATDLVRSVPGAESLTDAQIIGIASGIVAGAVVADFLGGSGLATIALAAGGGVLGNWIAGSFE